MILRLISGALGLATLGFTFLHDTGMVLAGYIAIGCFILGVYLLFYAMTGDWLPTLTNRKRKR